MAFKKVAGEYSERCQEESYLHINMCPQHRFQTICQSIFQCRVKKMQIYAQEYIWMDDKLYNGTTTRRLKLTKNKLYLLNSPRALHCLNIGLYTLYCLSQKWQNVAWRKTLQETWPDPRDTINEAEHNGFCFFFLFFSFRDDYHNSVLSF